MEYTKTHGQTGDKQTEHKRSLYTTKQQQSLVSIQSQGTLELNQEVQRHIANVRIDEIGPSDALLTSLGEDPELDGPGLEALMAVSNRKKRKDRRAAGKTVFVGAPGEEAVLQGLATGRN